MTNGRGPASVMLIGLGLLLGSIPGGARAQLAATTSTAAGTLDSPERALAVARAAFEYRDFAQVVSALDPWVHPPRIRDPATMVAARRLMGVSLHVLGEERAAREEFAQLLLLDPSHRLDPFLIPPQVIATFEDVRAQLGPGLRPPTEVGVGSGPELVLHPSVLWMPLGVPQIVQDAPGTGIALGALQVLGLALNIAAYLRGESLRSTDLPGTVGERDTWLGLQYTGLGVFVFAYAGSVVHGHLLRSDAGPSLPVARRSAPPVPGLGFAF